VVVNQVAIGKFPTVDDHFENRLFVSTAMAAK